MTLGQVNEHRIIRAPAKAGSYAEVNVLLPNHELAHIRLEYMGGELYGRPALTPTCDSLAQVIHGISQQAAVSILQDIDEAATERQTYARDAPHLRWRGPRPPICPRVVVGQPLRLRLPVPYGKISSLDIGVVQEITLHAT